jgi:hypothetical protein
MKVRIILVGEAAGLSNLPPLHLWKKTALLNEIDTKSSTQEQFGVGALWLVLSWLWSKIELAALLLRGIVRC